MRRWVHHIDLTVSDLDRSGPFYVDQLHIRLVEISATILDPPAHYSQYRDGYYALFFADPDGLKLEFVYTPQA